MRLLVPVAVESYESRRRRELCPVIEQLDQEMKLLIDEIRVSRGSSGFVLYDALPTPFREREVLELENRRSVLVEKRNIALREFCTL
jgi:hypothetical protein